MLFKKSKKLISTLLTMFMVFTMVIANVVPALAAPVTWSTVNSVYVDANNTTITVESDYSIDITLGTSIDYDDISEKSDASIVLELDPYDQGFEFNQNIEIGLSKGEEIIEHEAQWDFDNRKVIISPKETVDAWDTITVKVPSVTNPGMAGNETFAWVYLEDELGYTSNSRYASIQITAPELMIETEMEEIEVYLRNKLTIFLWDPIAEKKLIAPLDINSSMQSTWQGEYYQREADVNSDRYFTIKKGQESAVIYYRPESIGVHNLRTGSLYYSGAWIDSASTQITVNPAKEVESWLQFQWPNAATAGIPEKYEIVVHNKDQYYNNTGQTKEMELSLEAFATELDGAIVEDFKGKLYEADEGGNLLKNENGNYVEVETIIIPDGENTVAFYYYDERATNDPNYNVYISAIADGLGTIEQEIYVDPSWSKNIVVETISGNAKTTNDKFALKVYLTDEFGNIAYSQPNSLTVTLHTDSRDGKFYSDANLTRPISQLTFSEFQSWSSWESVKYFYYKDTEAGHPTITVKTTDLEDGEITLTIIDAPTITLTPSNTTGEVNLHQKIEIEFSEELESDVLLQLFSNKSGAFYKKPTDNNSSISNITVQAGEKSAVVYYRPTEVGTHNITAFTNSFGDRVETTTTMEITPAKEVNTWMEITRSPKLTAGIPSAFELTVYNRDQYNNDTGQQKEIKLNIQAFATNADGEKIKAEEFNGKLYEADENGDLKVDGNDAYIELTEITIPQEESTALFYYYDEKATNSNYNVYIVVIDSNQEFNNTLGKYEEKVSVMPDEATQVRVLPTNVHPELAKDLEANPETWVDAKPVYSQFELEVTLLDQYGNIANYSNQPVTIELTTDTESGMFYGDDQFRNPISQITFHGQPFETIYYMDTKDGAVTVKAASKTTEVEEDSIELKVLPLPKSITVETNENDWMINQRGEITVKLWNEDETVYEVPVELKDGLDIKLTSNPTGKFYTTIVGGRELTNNIVNIPAENEEVSLYFNPGTPGNVQLAASLSYVKGSYTVGSGTADVVWVVDRSGSMGSAASSIANNINTFVNTMQQSGINYNLGILYYEGYEYQQDSNVAIEFSNGSVLTRDLLEFRDKMLWVSQNLRGGFEATMTATQQALDYPFTGNAPYIIVVTDERGDDNKLLDQTKQKALDLGATVYGIFNYGDLSLELRELVQDTNGIEFNIYSDWGANLDTLATHIVSKASDSSVIGVKDITVKPAGGVKAVFDQPLEFTAGMLEELNIILEDQYGNKITDGSAEVTLFTKTIYGQASTGLFYTEEDIDEDGKIVGEGSQEINVTITAKGMNQKVYYYDKTKTDANYELYMGIRSLMVDGGIYPVTITEQESKNLSITIGDHIVYDDLLIQNHWDYISIPGFEGEQDKILSGEVFPVEVSIVDEFGNFVGQSTPLTVNLSATSETDEPIYGKFYLDAERKQPITQVTIGGNYSSSIKLYFVAEETGKGKLTVTAPGLEKAEFNFESLAADRLMIHFDHYNNTVAPEERKAIYIILTDEVGHPAKASKDIEVTLDGGDFYMNDWEGRTIDTIVIPKGHHGALVYVQGQEDGVNINVEVSSDDLISGTALIEVTYEPFYYVGLKRGWNILSTPVKLQKTSIQEIIKDADEILELAYIYDAENSKFIPVYQNEGIWRVNYNGKGNNQNPEFTLKPMEAIFLKMKGEGHAAIYPFANISGPYTKELKKGWNLIGPSMDISVNQQYSMLVDELLVSIGNAYTQIISPAVGYQNAWTYVPRINTSKSMVVNRGYWILMKEDAVLSGFGYTPFTTDYSSIYNALSQDENELNVLAMQANSITAPPLLPAAFGGKSNGFETGVVTAVVDNTIVAETQIVDGEYGINSANLVVQVEEGVNTSKQVEFFVNGLKTQQTASLMNAIGSLIKRDLTVVDNPWKEINNESVQKVNSNKQWTIEFNMNLKNLTQSQLEESIVVCDEEGNKVNVLVELGKDNKSIIVKAPSSGYKEGIYTIYVSNLASKDNKILREASKMVFEVIK